MINIQEEIRKNILCNKITDKIIVYPITYNNQKYYIEVIRVIKKNSKNKVYIEGKIVVYNFLENQKKEQFFTLNNLYIPCGKLMYNLKYITLNEFKINCPEIISNIFKVHDEISIVKNIQKEKILQINKWDGYIGKENIK